MTNEKQPHPGKPGGGEPDETLPPGVPEPPDMGKVDDLRERMDKDRSSHSGAGRGFLKKDTGEQAKAIGTYTIIPMMMVAGPLVGYLLGKGVENMFGWAPWPGVIGMLFGLVAAFRQVFLLLVDKSRKK
ncbi:MAG: AtpZ/AtpI family protein [Candidatus Krumholzibacteriota bacterium]